ncbi:MAG: GNAT family N-acetyltransferase [Defluviitaleaceae bacterium]|nr:GNAT family N-acetyltransferase [Defluviitaleaceae bacterium]
MRLKKEVTTERLRIISAVESDINFIIETEKHPDNKDFIWIGTYEEHLAEINDGQHLLLVFYHVEDNIPIGYSLSKVDFKSEVFELRRFVVTDKGKGYGREAINAHLKYAFEELNINRFWLDVYPDNVAGIKLYESLKMKKDGVLRQSYKADRGYLDQIVYSMLKNEYFSNLIQ